MSSCWRRGWRARHAASSSSSPRRNPVQHQRTRPSPPSGFQNLLSRNHLRLLLGRNMQFSPGFSQRWKEACVFPQRFQRLSVLCASTISDNLWALSIVYHSDRFTLFRRNQTGEVRLVPQHFFHWIRSRQWSPPVFLAHFRVDDLFFRPFSLAQIDNRLRGTQRHVVARFPVDARRVRGHHHV